MKQRLNNISPFLLLIVPFMVILAIMAIQTSNITVDNHIPLQASFFRLPDFDIFRIFFR